MWFCHICPNDDKSATNDEISQAEYGCEMWLHQKTPNCHFLPVSDSNIH